MTRGRADYTLEFKQEAARLVRAGQRQADVAASLGVSGQTLSNWVKAEAAGKLSGGATVKPVSPEQMEISRLKAELSRVKMERDILKKATAYFAKESS
jgi:transposase